MLTCIKLDISELLSGMQRRFTDLAIISSSGQNLQVSTVHFPLFEVKGDEYLQISKQKYRFQSKETIRPSAMQRNG
jgi:hypothetical protein